MKRFVFAALCIWLALPSSSMAHQGLDAKLEALDRQLKLHPRDADLLRERIQVHRILRNHSAITVELTRLQADDPGIPWLEYEVAEEALVAGDLQKAKSAVERYLKPSLSLSDQFASQLLRAKILQGLGHFDQAVAAYRDALALDDSVEAYLRGANLLVRMGQLDAAAGLLRKGMKRLGAITIRRRLIDVERARGQTSDALAWIEEAMEGADVKTTWLLLRAEVLDDQERNRDARRDRLRALDEADRLVRKRRSALALCDRARALMSLERYADAIRDLEAAQKKSPTLLEIHQLLARAKTLGGGQR
jgi:tetratricopeptide (TPR) repeat protein